MGKVYRVLLIEDDESNAELIRLHLNKLDIAIELEVIDNEQMLTERLYNHPPDLIISDYNLPDFTGMDALKKVREKYSHLPFILVSGYIGEEQAVDAMLQGASDYAMKDNLDRLGPAVKRELLSYEGRKKTEEKLEKSRDRYHVLLEHVKGIVWEADADTFKFHYVSPQSEEILGYTPTQWYENDNFWRNHIHPDDREETIKFCHHKSQQGENHTFEYRMITAGNEVVWLRDYVTVILTEDGKPDMLRGLMIDITKQKRAERQRDKAYDIAGIGHWEVDVINNELYWSDAVKKLHEVPNDYQPTLEKGINFYKEGNHRDTIAEVVDQSISFGKPFDEELKIVTANGNEQWVRAKGEPEMVDGKCIRLYGSFQDIHDRKVSELELARRNRFIETTLDNLPIGIAVNSIDTGQTILMNKQFSEIYGWPEEDLNDIETFFEKVYPDKKYREKIKTRVLGDIESGYPERMSWKNIHITTKDGEKRIINAKNIPLPDQNQMISTVVDVTAEKEAEKEKIRTLERIDDAFFSVNNDWVVTYWNNKAEQVLGRSREDIINKNLWEVYDDAVELDFYTQYHKAVEEQVTVHFEEFYPAVEKWFEVSAYPSEAGLSVYFRDITERKEHEEKLSELSLVASKTTDVIIMTDDKENITWVNEAFEVLTGYSFDEAIGQNPGELLQGPETNPETVSRIARAIEQPTSIQEVILNYSKTGKKYWLDLTIDPIFDEDKTCTGFIAIQKDVTDQIERERKLKESVDRYDIVAKATSDTIWDLDLENDRVEYNSNIYSMFGYDRQEVDEVGKWWRDKIHPEDRATVLNTIDQVLAANIDRFQMEYRFQASDGTYKYIYDRAFVVTDDENKPIRMIGAMQDITQQKAEQEWLKLFESAISTTTESVAILEPKPNGLPGRKILYVNEAFKDMTGYSQEEVVNKQSLHILNGPKTSQKKIDKLWESMQRWESCEVEFIIYRKNGDELWIHVSMAPVQDTEGKYSNWVCVGRDITSRKEHEKELRESLKEKETLLMEVHHRVKNNLAIVSGMMQLQAFQEDNEYVKEKLHDSMSRIKTMGSIHELLYQSSSFSRIKIDQNIRQLISNLTDTFQLSIDLDIEYNLQPIELNINQAIPCSLILNEVVTNIFKHAFKERNTGTLSVDLSEQSEEIHIEIKDNGRGLPDDFETASRENSLGLTLIDTLTNQLDAEYIYRRLDPGVSFLLSFKKAEVKGIGNIYL